MQMRLCSLRRTTGSDVYRITTGKMPTMQQSAFGSHPFGGSLAASVREKPLQVRFNPCFCWALRTIIYRLLASDLRRGLGSISGTQAMITLGLLKESQRVHD